MDSAGHSGGSGVGILVVGGLSIWLGVVAIVQSVDFIISGFFPEGATIGGFSSVGNMAFDNIQIGNFLGPFFLLDFIGIVEKSGRVISIVHGILSTGGTMITSVSY